MILNTLLILGLFGDTTHSISNPFNRKIALNNMLQDKYLKFSLSFQLLMMGLNLTSDTAMHPEKSSIIALSTHRLSSRTKYYVNFICLWLITVIRLRSCIWCGQHDHKYYQQHGHSLETHEDQNHSLIWKHSQRTDIHTLANRILYF